jgi:hypothetical protein
MQLLASKFAAIATAIDSTNAQITALQAKLSELQEHQQQLLSVEQACQSALSQVDTALMMLHHVDPAEIATFKNALVVKFNNEAIAQIEPAAPATPAATSTEPTEPIAPTPPDTNPVIDIESTPATDTPATDTPATDTTATDTTATDTTATDTTDSDTTDIDIEKTLDSLSLQSFRKLAKSKKLDSRLSRATLTARLKAITTRDEVLAVS